MKQYVISLMFFVCCFAIQGNIYVLTNKKEHAGYLRLAMCLL